MQTHVYTYDIELPDGGELQLQFLADSDESADMQLHDQLDRLGFEMEIEA